MDVRSMYAMKLGELIDVFSDAEGVEPVTHAAQVSGNLIAREFVVVCNDACVNQPECGNDPDPSDVPERQVFDNVFDAIDAAMALAGDPRGWSVYLGFDVSCNDDQYVEVKHLAQVRHIG